MKASKKQTVLWAAAALFALAFARPAAAAAPEPYLSDKVDSANDNQLWTLEKHGEYYQILLKGGKLALDSDGGKKMYLNDKLDAANDNQLWTLRKEGDYVMLIPKAGGKVAVDANAGKAKPYFSDKVDAENDNQLFMLKKQGDYSQIVLKGGKFALDGNAGK
jgi:hypothetical protein